MVAARGATASAGRWLSRPSRVAGIARRPARMMLIALVLLSLLAALLLSAGTTPPEFLHDAIVATLRHGGGFYDTALDLLRTESDARTARLFPSTLAVFEAALPGWLVTAVIAAALTTLLWVGGLRLGGLVARTPGAVMIVSLLGGGVISVALLWLSAPHAGVAAILVALAIVVRRREDGITAAAIGCAAALVDPAALIAITALGVLAALDGTRRESMAWSIALIVAAAAFALHLHTLAEAVLPGATIMPDGALARLVGAAFLDIPTLLAGPLLLLSAFGWATVSDAIGPRVLAVMVAGVAFDGLMGVRSATLATALVAPGVALVPGGIAELLRGALDRRRITVTRIAR